MEDLFEAYLEGQAKAAIAAVKRYREGKRRLLEDDDEESEPQPHVEERQTSKSASGAKPEKKKPKKAAAPIEGPCEGRIWLDPPSSCPGAEAGRGKNPERDAQIFERAVYEKKRHVFCRSCKNEYKKSK